MPHEGAVLTRVRSPAPPLIHTERELFPFRPDAAIDDLNQIRLGSIVVSDLEARYQSLEQARSLQAWRVVFA